MVESPTLYLRRPRSSVQQLLAEGIHPQSGDNEWTPNICMEAILCSFDEDDAESTWQGDVEESVCLQVNIPVARCRVVDGWFHLLARQYRSGTGGKLKNDRAVDILERLLWITSLPLDGYEHIENRFWPARVLVRGGLKPAELRPVEEKSGQPD